MATHVDLSEVEAAQAAAEAAEADQKAKAEAVREKNKEIYDRILDGETTGDRLVDHVIRRNFGHNPEAVELFRSLEERVAAHVGEPVVVVSRGTEYSGHEFGKGLTNPHLVTRIGAGILTGPELNVGENGAWSFPTDLHVNRGGEASEGPLTTDAPGRHGGLGQPPLEGALDQPVRSRAEQLGFESLSGETGDEKQLEVAVGAEEIDELIKSTLFFEREQLDEMLDRLTRLPTGAETSET